MTNKSYPVLGSLHFSALVFAAACGLTACAADEGDPNAQVPFNPGFTQDGSAVVGAPDAGMIGMQPPLGINPTPDASTVVPMFDAGVTPPVVTGTGVVVPMGDAAVVVPMGDAAAPDAAVAMRPDQGMGDGKDVITIGDSWMNLDNSVGIQQSLEKISKRDYRNLGSPGTKLLDDVIPNQYSMAKMQGPVKTVIMTGGGNDVLQDPALGPIAAVLLSTPGCLDTVFNAACKTRIDEVTARLEKLWAEMAKDGVQDVVIIAYTNKALGGEYKMSQAYSTQKITPVCNNVPAPLRCSSVETDIVVPDAALRLDSIHPDDATYDKIGAAVWAHMQKLGMRR